MLPLVLTSEGWACRSSLAFTFFLPRVGQLREIEDVWSAGGQGLVSLKVGGAGVWVFMPEDLDGPPQPFLPGKLHLSSHAAHRPPLPLCVSDGRGPHGLVGWEADLFFPGPQSRFFGIVS